MLWTLHFEPKRDWANRQQRLTDQGWEFKKTKDMSQVLSWLTLNQPPSHWSVTELGHPAAGHRVGAKPHPAHLSQASPGWAGPPVDWLT